MFGSLAGRLFGSANQRHIKKLTKTVEQINAIEPQFEALDDTALAAKTVEFRERLDNGESLDDLLVEAFATVREAAKRTLGQRHFDVQLLGGMVLHSGTIAEMKTGEGKTLVAHAAGLPQCPDRRWRACRHGQRLTWPDAMPSGWARFIVSWA